MTGKHYLWHSFWERLPDGLMRHTCGAVFSVRRLPDGSIEAIAAPETLDEFQRAELARGVPLHDLAARLQRLAREAARLFPERRP